MISSKTLSSKRNLTITDAKPRFLNAFTLQPCTIGVEKVTQVFGVGPDIGNNPGVCLCYFAEQSNSNFDVIEVHP